MTTPNQEISLSLSALRCAAGTDVGMRRDENQDSFGIIRHENFHAFFVADGMGGVKGGAIASRLAISTLREALPTIGGGITPDAVREVVQRANSKIFEEGASHPGLGGMGTTLVGLVFTPRGVISVNVGDSRIYRVRGEEVLRLSEDHTLVRELLRSGAISEQEAQGHPISHMLTRSLGPLAEVAVDCRVESEIPIEGDVFVLCSDGLYNFVQDEEIGEVIRQNPLDDANQILINLANRRGGADNITVLVISVGERSGRGRTGEYRAARGGTSESGATHGEVSGLTSSLPAVESVSSRELIGGLVEEESIEPPAVEEPRDYHAERERMKKSRSRLRAEERRTLPIWVTVSCAVVFGLLAGDVARQAGGLPGIISGIRSLFASGSLRNGKGDEGTSFEELSRELAISRSRESSGEGLVDIIKRVQGERGASSGLTSSGSSGGDGSAPSRALLERAVAKLERQLADLSGKPPGGAVEALQRAVRQEAALKKELGDVEEQIGTASRKLSLWYGRRTRLQTEGQDIAGAKEDLEKVAANSEVVRRKLADYTESNYRFQAKRDESELYPANATLSAEVEGLRSSRERLRRELQDEVLKTVEGVLSDAYKQLEDLRTRRATLDSQLQILIQDSEFLEALADPNSDRRDTVRARLEDEIREAKVALSVSR